MPPVGCVDGSVVTSCDLLVLAELNLDLLLDCGDADIAFGQVETLVDSATLTLGSSGAITAAAAAAQGCRVAIAGVVGDDDAGGLVIQRLMDLGVDVRGVIRRGDVRTGITIVLSRPGGDRALLTYPGAMSALTVDLVDPGLLAAARHVHVSSPFLQTGLQPGLSYLLRSVQERGATTSIDPGWDPADDWSAVRDLLPVVDHLLPNAAEAARLACRPVLSSTAAAAQWLAANGPTVAVKLGADGGALISRDTRLRVCGVPVTSVGHDGGRRQLRCRIPDGAAGWGTAGRSAGAGRGVRGGRGHRSGRDRAAGRPGRDRGGGCPIAGGRVGGSEGDVMSADVTVAAP